MRNMYWTITICLVVLAFSFITLADYGKRHPDSWVGKLMGQPSRFSSMDRYEQQTRNTHFPSYQSPAPNQLAEVTPPPQAMPADPLIVPFSVEERNRIVENELKKTHLFSQVSGNPSIAEPYHAPEQIVQVPRPEVPVSTSTPFAESYVEQTVRHTESCMNWMDPTYSVLSSQPFSVMGTLTKSSRPSPDFQDNKQGPEQATVRFYPLGNLVSEMNTSEQTVIELLCSMIAPESWQANGGQGHIVYFAPGKCLIVRHQALIQSQIGEFVQKLRASVEGTLGSGESNPFRITSWPRPSPLPEAQITDVPMTKVITIEDSGNGMNDLPGMFPLMNDGRLIPIAAVELGPNQNSIIPAGYAPKPEEEPKKTQPVPSEKPQHKPRFYPPLVPVPFLPLPQGPQVVEEDLAEFSNVMREFMTLWWNAK